MLERGKFTKGGPILLDANPTLPRRSTSTTVRALRDGLMGLLPGTRLPDNTGGRKAAPVHLLGGRLYRILRQESAVKGAAKAAR